MTYSVKEIYYTLQGEGAHTGRPAVFCRFAGCNLWSGLEKDRHTAVCQFCDTDFVGTDGPGGGRFTSATKFAETIAGYWPCPPVAESPGFVVLTGGEPLLQVDSELIDALHAVHCLIAVETNGTIKPPDGLDWICVSPKAGSQLLLTSGDELKLVFPQPNALPEQFIETNFDHFFLQPMDGPEQATNTQQAIEYCKQHPQWRLSIQSHKLLRIP